LIAEHEDEMTAGRGSRHGVPPVGVVTLVARRQRSEQNLTSLQFLIHALRHVMSRPQWTQGFVGRLDLLPRCDPLRDADIVGLSDLRACGVAKWFGRHQRA